MLFGLSDAPTSFQGYINKILVKKFDILVIINLDDIFIYTENPSQNNMTVVQQILDDLKKHGFFPNFKKCRFYKDEICFLDYIVSAWGIKINDKKIELVKNWPKPQLVKDIEVFLGFANFYYRFIKDFNRIATPFTSILKTLLSLSESQARKIANKVNDEVIRGENRSDNIIFLSKKSKNAKSKNLICA